MDGIRLYNNAASPVNDLPKVDSGINRSTPSIEGGEKTFAQSLKDAVNEVNQLQKISDIKSQELATGKTQNISEVMIAAEKADISLRLMVQVRNKIIEAYQEMMKMQV